MFAFRGGAIAGTPYDAREHALNPHLCPVFESPPELPEDDTI